jgi:hypothetical protein
LLGTKGTPGRFSRGGEDLEVVRVDEELGAEEGGEREREREREIER